MSHDRDASRPPLPRPSPVKGEGGRRRFPFPPCGGGPGWGVAAVLLALFVLATGATADEASDATLRRHAGALAGELVCLPCGGATVAASDRPEAETVRLFLARRLAAGEDGRAAIAAALATWPEDLVHRAPGEMPVWARWAGPPVLIAGLLLLIAIAWRRMQWRGDIGGAVSFDRAERERLDRLVDRLVRAHDSRRDDDGDGKS